MKKSLVIAMALMTFVPAALMAEGYGMAGCGLGSLVIKNNTKVMQVLAATTNGTFYSQTFGITTGTSNCTAGGVVQADKEKLAFVETSKTELMSDMAAGQGEYLSTLAGMYSCGFEVLPEFNKVAQENYSTLANSSAPEILSTIEAKIAENPVLAKGCAAL